MGFHSKALTFFLRTANAIRNARYGIIKRSVHFVSSLLNSTKLINLFQRRHFDTINNGLVRIMRTALTTRQPLISFKKRGRGRETERKKEPFNSLNTWYEAWYCIKLQVTTMAIYAKDDDNNHTAGYVLGLKFSCGLFAVWKSEIIGFVHRNPM